MWFFLLLHSFFSKDDSGLFHAQLVPLFDVLVVSQNFCYYQNDALTYIYMYLSFWSLVFSYILLLLSENCITSYILSHIFASNEQRNVSKRFGCTTTPHSFAVAAFSCPFQVHFFRPQKRSPKIISSKPREKKVWKWKDFFVVLKKKICN